MSTDEADDRIVTLVVYPDGRAGTEWLTRSSADEYGTIVGGMVEAISGDGWAAYLNEEGKLVGLQANARADSIARLHGWKGSPDDVLTGPVIFTGPIDDDGYDTSVSVELTREVLGQAHI